MLALDQQRAPGIFADHADPSITHIVPDTLQLAMADGMPDFQLMLFRSLTSGGGQLTARFAPLHSSEGLPGKPVARRQRIALRTQANDLEVLLDWQTVIAERDGTILFRHTMTPHQATLATEIAENGSPLLELTLEEDRPAMRGPQPWQVTGDPQRVHGMLLAQLGDTPATQQALAMAVHGMSDDQLHWVSLGLADAVPDDAAWAALVSRIANRFCDETAGGHYVVKPTETATTLDLRLDRPWAEMLRTRLTWGFDQAPELVEGDAFAHHFPTVDQSDPFVNTELSVINHIPLDALSAQRLQVDVAFSGSTGTQTHQSFAFEPGGDTVMTQGIVLGDFGQDFELQSRARVLLPPSGGQGFPMFWPRDDEFKDNNQSRTVTVSASDIDAQLHRFEVLEEVFALTDKVHVSLDSEIYSTRITLDSDTPSAWVILPDQRAEYTTTVEVERGDDSHVVTPRLGHDGFTLLPLDLVPQDPVTITTALSPDIVLAIVEWAPVTDIDRIRSAIVTPSQAPQLLYWPASVFDPFEIRWRARVVRRDADGNTRPMVDGDWSETSEPHFEII